MPNLIVQTMPSIPGLDPLEQTVRALEAEIATDGWDQPPSFWLVCESERGMWTVHFPMPSIVYMDPPEYLGPVVAALSGSPSALSLLHSGLRGLLASFPGTNRIKALGIFFEGYTLDQTTPREEIDQCIKNRSVYKHPNRIEERCGLFATVDGDYASITRRRDDFPEFSVLDPLDGATCVVGRIPAALKDLLVLMTLDMT